MTIEERETHYREWLERYESALNEFSDDEISTKLYFLTSLKAIAPRGLENYRFVSAEEYLIRLKALLDAKSLVDKKNAPS